MFGDVAEAEGVAAGVLAGIESAVGGHAASAVEAGDRLEGVDYGQGGEPAHAGVGTQAGHTRVALRPPFQLALDLLDALAERVEQFERVLALEGRSGCQRQGLEPLLAPPGPQPAAPGGVGG